MTVIGRLKIRNVANDGWDYVAPDIPGAQGATGVTGATGVGATGVTGATGTAGAAGSASWAVPPTTGRTSYTYTYSGTQPSGLGDGADAGHTTLTDSILAQCRGAGSAPVGPYYDSAYLTDYWAADMGIPQVLGWSMDVVPYDGVVGWLAADSVVIADLGSALTLDHITLVGWNDATGGIATPIGFKVRSASDSGITTNVLTPFADITSLTANPFGTNQMWVAKLNVSGAAARRYWEITTHRTGSGGVYLAISELALYASA